MLGRVLFAPGSRSARGRVCEAPTDSGRHLRDAIGSVLCYSCSFREDTAQDDVRDNAMRKRNRSSSMGSVSSKVCRRLPRGFDDAPDFVKIHEILQRAGRLPLVKVRLLAQPRSEGKLGI